MLTKSKSKDKAKKGEVKVSKILVASRPAGATVVGSVNFPSTEPLLSSPLPVSAVPLPAHQPHHHPRKSEFQLLRPRTDHRDASVRSVNLLDSSRQTEIARDVPSIVEKSLLPDNSCFRVVGALGASHSGRSSTLLSSLMTNTLPVDFWKNDIFPHHSLGLNLFVHAERRLIFLDFPPVRNSLQTPRQQQQPNGHDHDLKMVVTALTVCHVLFLCLTPGEESRLFNLVKNAVESIGFGKRTAHLVVVRHFVPVESTRTFRRIQCDERMWFPLAKRVIHVPKVKFEEDHPLLMEVQREIAREACMNFASQSMLVNQHRAMNEVEWFHFFMAVFSETRSHSTLLGAEVKV